MEISELLAAILDLAKELVNSDESSLLLTDVKTGDLIFYVVTGDKGKLIKGEKVPKGAGIAGTVVTTGKPLIVNNVQDDSRHFSEIDKISEYTTNSILCVPIKIKGELMGVLEAVNADDREGFDEWDVKLLTYLADQAAIAISNRRLYDELSERVEELTALYEITQSISYAAIDENIFNVILNSLANFINVEKASITFYDKINDKFTVTASIGLPESINKITEIDLSQSITGFVFKSGEPLIISDIENEITFPFKKKEGYYKTGSFISTPIRYKNEIIGILNLADKKDHHSFDSFDLKVISTIGAHIAEIYQNLLYQKKIHRQKRLTQEINIASEIQKKILPDIPGEIGNHQLAAFTKPAKEMGGDFYDLFRFDNNKYAVLVADVSGKSIPAALFMGAARNIIRAEARVYNQPGNVLSIANKYINEDSESGMFVTAFYMLVDVQNNLITYSNAGHNDQVFLKNKTKEIIKLNARGKALGLNNDSVYEEKIIQYESGDTAVMFTDGVLEYLGNGNLNKGEDRLIESLIENNKSHPSKLINLYKEHLGKNYVDDDTLDDFTLFAIKF